MKKKTKNNRRSSLRKLHGMLKRKKNLSKYTKRYTFAERKKMDNPTSLRKSKIQTIANTRP